MAEEPNEHNTAPDAITISPAILQQMIADAVAKAGATPTPLMDFKGLADAIVGGIVAQQPPRKMTIGEYVRKGGRSAFHPKSEAETPQMTRKYYQNGAPLQHSNTFDREIELLNQITHSGRYIDRLVEVIVSDDGSDQTVNVRFNNKTDGVYKIKDKGAKDFTAMLELIVAEQKIERHEAEVREEETKTRRQYFKKASEYKQATP